MSEIEKSLNKSQDKLDIQEEEREKEKLAADGDTPPTDPPDPPPSDESKEGEAKDGEAAEAGAEEQPAKTKSGLKKGLSNIKNKIPPLFNRSKSKERKEKKQEDTTENEEDKKLLQGDDAPTSPTKTDEVAAIEEGEEKPAPTDKSWSKDLLAKIPKVKMPSNPFKKGNKGCEPVELKEAIDEEAGEEEEPKKEEAEKEEEETDAEPKPTPVSRTTQLLKAIKAPLVAVWPKRNKEEDAEAGETDPEKQKLDSDDVEDGLEKVELNEVEVDGEKPEKEGDDQKGDEESLVASLRTTFKQHRFLIIGLIVFLSLLMLLIILAITGPRRPRYNEMLVNGTYITAVTSCGLVQGLLDEGEFTFKGIPYAVPPLEDRRFAPAEPLRSVDKCWNGTFKAWYNESDAAPAQCWHLYRNGSYEGNENCLTLDVYTRRVRYDAPLPVVVLVSAESLAGGHSWRPARGMARQRDVVFVQPRFRLGPFGFLVANAITRANYPPHSGNYALSDLVAALEWVQINVEHFGGNPDSVTVVGHRAGASLVTALTAMPKRRGAPIQRLFHQVWVSSGSGAVPNQTLSEAESHGFEMMRAIGCRNIDCLRRTDAEEILERVPSDWKPTWKTELPIGVPPVDQHRWLVQDGVIVQQNLFQSWKEHGLPYKMVIGTTAHVEASPEVSSKKDWSQRANFENYLRSSVLGSTNVPSGILGEVLKRYQPPSWPQLAAIISDLRTICPLYQTAKELATVSAGARRVKNPSSVHFYVVTQPRNTTTYGSVSDVGADIDAILGLYEAHSPEEKRYLSAMQNFFYRFVWHGELPAGSSGTEKSSSLPHNIMLVGQDLSVSSTYENCDFWLQRELATKYARQE